MYYVYGGSKSGYNGTSTLERLYTNAIGNYYEYINYHDTNNYYRILYKKNSYNNIGITMCREIEGHETISILELNKMRNRIIIPQRLRISEEDISYKSHIIMSINHDTQLDHNIEKHINLRIKNDFTNNFLVCNMKAYFHKGVSDPKIYENAFNGYYNNAFMSIMIKYLNILQTKYNGNIRNVPKDTIDKNTKEFLNLNNFK